MNWNESNLPDRLILVFARHFRGLWATAPDHCHSIGCEIDRE